jgi:hypothetical protein
MAPGAAMSTLTPEQMAEDKGPAIIISMSITTAVATMFLAARLFVRARLLGKMHWDDYLITVSLVRTHSYPLSLL